MDVDEDLSHLDADLEIKCWSSTHRAYAFGVGLPVLIIWGKFQILFNYKVWAFLFLHF